MRFYLEPDMLTGKTDEIGVQAIGRWGDNIFVIDAETQDEAREKLLDLMEKRAWQGQVRPATEDEAKEFEEAQDEAKNGTSGLQLGTRNSPKGSEMSKQLKRRTKIAKQPSKVAVLADLLRVTEEAGTMEISRDYFRANSRFRDKWNMLLALIQGVHRCWHGGR